LLFFSFSPLSLPFGRGISESGAAVYLVSTPPFVFTSGVTQGQVGWKLGI
jgi:hypothetical protein